VRHAATLITSLLFLVGCERQAATERESATESLVPLRTVTLAPHLAELVFAVGAGDTLVGVSSFTDFPEAASELPVVSDAFVTDLELLAVVRPNLLLAWESGTPAHVIDNLRAAGYRVEVVQTRSLEDVAGALEYLGDLTGQSELARSLANDYRRGIAQRRARFSGSAPIRVFYQISMRPLYTVNADHYISELIGVCGGLNVFSDLVDLAPMVAVEAVIERDPEVLLAGDIGRNDSFDEWQRWPNLAANRYANHFLLPATELGRPTPRLLVAADAMCEALDNARANRRDYAPIR
jgi:iron complex transport system substrate-binding protein